MMTDHNYCVRYVDHPNTHIRGSVHIDEDGYASIFINSRLSQAQQLRTLEHELKHIEHDDAYNADPLSQAEDRASGKGSKELQPTDPLQAYYDRGFQLYGLQRDDPLWDRLFSVWYFRDCKDRYLGVFDQHSVPSKRKAALMIRQIFDDH